MRVCAVQVTSNTAKMDTDYTEARDAIIRAVAATTGRFTMDQIADACGDQRERVRRVFRLLRDSRQITLCHKRRGLWIKTGAELMAIENKPPEWDLPDVDELPPSIVDRAIAMRPLLVLAFDAAIGCKNGQR